MDQLICQVTAYQWTAESRCKSQKSRVSGEVEILRRFGRHQAPFSTNKGRFCGAKAFIRNKNAEKEENEKNVRDPEVRSEFSLFAAVEL